MDLTYQLKGSGESRNVRITFDPPLAGYEEVKPRLMNMKGEAEEALGMVRTPPSPPLSPLPGLTPPRPPQIRAPQVTEFSLSNTYTTTAVAVTFLVYCTLAAEYASAPEYASLVAPGNLVLSYLPSWSLQFSWGMVVVCHSLEALYVGHLCRKHRTGLIVGVSVMGFRSGLSLSRRLIVWWSVQAQYIIGTLLLGFPVIRVLRHKVQDARIDSILKGN